MTLADRLAATILEHGPMAECHLATAVQKRKEDASAELKSNPDRFIHNGRRARASRWDVRRDVVNGADDINEPAVTFPPDYDRAEEALVKLIRQGRECPYEALVRVVCAVNGARA